MKKNTSIADLRKAWGSERKKAVEEEGKLAESRAVQSAPRSTKKENGSGGRP